MRNISECPAAVQLGDASGLEVRRRIRRGCRPTNVVASFPDSSGCGPQIHIGFGNRARLTRCGAPSPFLAFHEPPSCLRCAHGDRPRPNVSNGTVGRECPDGQLGTHCVMSSAHGRQRAPATWVIVLELAGHKDLRTTQGYQSSARPSLAAAAPLSTVRWEGSAAAGGDVTDQSPKATNLEDTNSSK